MQIGDVSHREYDERKDGYRVRMLDLPDTMPGRNELPLPPFNGRIFSRLLFLLIEMGSTSGSTYVGYRICSNKNDM